MKRTMIVTLIILSACQLMVGPVFAGGVGTTAAPFLKIGMGARAMGMAGAFSAVADDATAVYWNPAGLATLEKDEVNLAFSQYFQDVSIGQAAYASRFKGKNIGVGVTYLRVPDIERRGLTDVAGFVPDQGSFAASDMAVSFACAKKDAAPSLLANLDTGAALKIIRSSIDTKSATAVAVDAGARYRARDNMSFSLALQNLGTPMKFKSDSDPLPLNLKAAAAYRPMKALTLGLELDEYLLDQKFYASFGGEVWVRNALALRAGYRFGYDTSNLGAITGLSLGLGIKVSDLGLDYAFLPFGDLGNTHRFGFWIQF